MSYKVLKSMIKWLRYSITKTYDFLRRWNIWVGRDPHRINDWGIVIFPLLCATFCCGLAGIISIKRENGKQNGRLTELPFFLLEKIRNNGMAKILEHSLPAEQYLGGWSMLSEVEEFLRAVRQDVSFMKDGKEKLSQFCHEVNDLIRREETLIEENASKLSTAGMESINSAMIVFKDFAWSMENDLLSNSEKIVHIARVDDITEIANDALIKYRHINLLLNALDRLEVRGRDSAGIQIGFTLKDTDILRSIVKRLAENDLQSEWRQRLRPGDLMDESICLREGRDGESATAITFTYKKASATGELGENGRYLREKIRNDRIFQIVLSDAAEPDVYLGHTRWASVGSITEENCHPINNFTVDTVVEESTGYPRVCKTYPHYGRDNWWITVALNGDIDNYSTLRTARESEVSPLIKSSVTTDTKMIPLQIEKYLFSGCDLRESFRRALNDFEGSHAIAMQSNLEPDRVYLALRGSGQSLYVGICNDEYVYSSEVYGLVEVTPYFIKLDGENERIPGDSLTKGQIFILNRRHRGGLTEIEACYYDGYPLRISEDDVQKAEITTRDIDRKNYPHYLLKEILEAPQSVQTTLRGKYEIARTEGGERRVTFNLGNDVVPDSLMNALSEDSIKNIFVIGQGTAAVAAAAIAEAFSEYLRGYHITVEGKKASELSGFSLHDHLDQTLIVSVTQSGTTTDTNRAVAMAKERGAHTISIVNRRQSDITHLTDGVFYTSNGRDIEMSVASTKAFYSQIVAGYILALYFAQLLGTLKDERIARILNDLVSVPNMMHAVISQKETIKESAWYAAKRKTYWAVVGSGPNKVAADEIRIKLSELCYKTISSDIVEDKKHIDLSSEPLIVVCAAGNPESVAEDIVKDTAIFKAHAATVIVIANATETRFDDVADSVVYIPESSYPTSVILNTVAGHLWGYYAACSINDDAEFFRVFRNTLSLQVHDLDRREESLFEKLANTHIRGMIDDFSMAFHTRKNRGYFSSLSVEIASDIPLLLKYVAGKLPLEDFWREYEEKRISSSPLDMLDVCLGRAIDELARPIDAIRHQAKTVTVGTSRKGEMISGIIFDYMRSLELSLENLTSRDGSAVRRLQKAVSRINGYTVYDIDNIEMDGTPSEFTTISIRKRGGVSVKMKSRAENPVPLTGTKNTIISTGEIYAGVGKNDKAPIIIMPLLGEDHVVRHILLLHVAFEEKLTAAEKKEVLGEKFRKIKNLVNEYNLPWNDRYFEELPVEFLLGEGVDVVVGKIMG